MKLNGILWGNPPVAIIGGQSFYVGDVKTVNDGDAEVTIRCVDIQKNLVRIVNTGTGKEQDLPWAD